MTTTASRTDINAIQELLGLKNCKYIVANPGKIYIVKKCLDMDKMQMPIAKRLLDERTAYILTIMHLPLRLCGFAYKLFEYVLGVQQYFPPGCAAIPANLRFAQFPVSCSTNC